MTETTNSSEKQIEAQRRREITAAAKASSKMAERNARAEAREIKKASEARIAEAIRAAKERARLEERAVREQIEQENSTARRKENLSKAKCEYCDKSILARTLSNHLCDIKRRWMDRDMRVPTMAYKLYISYYEISYRHAKIPTYLSFAKKTSYYNAFCDFARYLIDIEALDTKEFIRFLYRQKIPMKTWKNPLVYQAFLLDMSKNESCDRAVGRNVMLMKEWAVETGERWTDFFRKVAAPRATLWIKLGRISPWVLLSTDSGRDLISRLSREQLTIIEDAVDFEFWMRKLDEEQDSVEQITQILREEGL